MEYYAVLKRNELSNREKTWRDCKFLLLSERSQSEKATNYRIPTIRFWKRQNYEDSKITAVARSLMGYRCVGGAQRIWGTVKPFCTTDNSRYVSYICQNPGKYNTEQSEPYCKLWTSVDNDVNIGSSN